MHCRARPRGVLPDIDPDRRHLVRNVDIAGQVAPVGRLVGVGKAHSGRPLHHVGQVEGNGGGIAAILVGGPRLQGLEAVQQDLPSRRGGAQSDPHEGVDNEGDEPTPHKRPPPYRARAGEAVHTGLWLCAGQALGSARNASWLALEYQVVLGLLEFREHLTSRRRRVPGSALVILPRPDCAGWRTAVWGRESRVAWGGRPTEPGPTPLTARDRTREGESRPWTSSPRLSPYPFWHPSGSSNCSYCSRSVCTLQPCTF